MSVDDTQEYYMNNEFCFHVDENDQIICKLSKYNSHRIDPITGLAPLHRAFSVFLLKRSDTNSTEFELLMQQRSVKKLTFPLLWANSCCSHPIDGLEEDTVVNGIVKAARRKLNHELGIPLCITEKKTFYYYNRIQYHANQDPWGEHEIDHILLLEADNELIESIKINPNEVKDIKFVPIYDLNSQTNLTPWIQKIINSGYITSWIDDFEELIEGQVCGTEYHSLNYLPLMVIEEPLDLIRLALDGLIYIKMKGDRELRGKLHAFDQHMNLVLGDVEEIKTVISEGEETAFIDGVGSPERITRNMEMIFVRGDSIILASPIN